MRIWCAVCTVLSGALLAAILSFMYSCDSSYFVGKDGALMKEGFFTAHPCTQCSPPPCRGHKTAPTVLSWDEFPPEFVHLSAQFLEGDTLAYSEIRNYLLRFLRMTRLVVTRQGSPPRTYRHNFLLSWTLVVLISFTPLLLWSIACLIIITNTPRAAGAT